LVEDTQQTHTSVCPLCIEMSGSFRSCELMTARRWDKSSWHI